MKKSYTAIIFITSILTTIIAIGSFFFILKVIKNKSQHSIALNTTLEDKIKQKDNAMLFAAKVTEIKNLQETIDNYFVDPSKIDKFVGYLENLGGEVGSSISVESIEVPPKSKNTISFNINIVGSFQEVMDTIVLLENISYQVNITQVYLNNDLKQTSAEGEIKQTSAVSIWQADVFFDIVSLE